MQFSGEVEALSDVPLCVQARLQCRELPLVELLALEPGSVIRSQRAAGDSVDVCVGGEFLSQGEILVMNNTLAVRLSDLDEKTQG